VALCPLDQHVRAPSFRRVAINAIKALHIGRVCPVTSLALVREVVGFRRIASARGRDGGADRRHAKEIAASDCGVEAIFHGAASIHMTSSGKRSQYAIATFGT
jgi:hypothetical protein